MKILLDNGHGINTAGKCSPLFAPDWREKYGIDRYREYKYCRERAAEIKSVLYAHGYDVELIVPEERDIPLAVRAMRVNNICRKLGASNVLLVSLHTDAARGLGWSTARGLSVRVSPKASTKSKILARYLYDAGAKRGLQGNRSVPLTHYWVQNLFILNETACPAVLTETGFQNNMADVELLLSKEGKKAVVDYHVEGITKYVEYCESL